MDKLETTIVTGNRQRDFSSLQDPTHPHYTSAKRIIRSVSVIEIKKLAREHADRISRKRTKQIGRNYFKTPINSANFKVSTANIPRKPVNQNENNGVIWNSKPTIAL